MRKKRVFLSCDPGHDDALAIILAGYCPMVELIGISTIAANQTVEKVTQNALEVLDAAGMHTVAVFQGQSKPLLRPPMQCPEIHGESGLELRSGSLPPSNLKTRPGKAVLCMYQLMLESQQRSGGRTHLVCTGPLTDAALLILLFPEVGDLLEQIVLMGGAIGSGNTNPSAEFNMQVDPEAAKIVFESGIPVVMIPLEVTHAALATEGIVSQIQGLATPFSALVAEVILFFAETYQKVFGFHSPPVHDPCAVAYVIAPEMFKTEKMRVDIEVVSPLTAGQTVCDIYHRSPLPKNALVAKEMDVDAFWTLLLAAIRDADKHSPLNANNTLRVHC